MTISDRPSVIEALEDIGIKVVHTGSREIMDNPPETSDDDWIVLYDPGVIDILTEHGLVPAGGENTSGGPDTTPWYSPDHKLNIILAYNATTFRRWLDATAEAKRLKLDKRDDRIALFKRYRVDDDPNTE